MTAEKRNLLVGLLTLSLKIDLSRGERDVTMEVFVTFMWKNDVPFFKLSEKFDVSFEGKPSKIRVFDSVCIAGFF